MNGPEHLCTWFLRLNGYLTTTNFYAHDSHETLGEIDVIGVRFPHSRELEFKDSDALKIPEGKIDLVLAEAKRGHIDSLDNSWISPEKQALEYIVQRVGMVHSEKVDEVCAALRKNRQMTVHDRSFRVICCARSMNDDLEKQGVTCVKWAEVLKFIQHRFHNNEKLKRQHEQWDCFGQYLWNQLTCGLAPDESNFFCGWEKTSGALAKACETPVGSLPRVAHHTSLTSSGSVRTESPPSG